MAVVAMTSQATLAYHNIPPNVANGLYLLDFQLNSGDTLGNNTTYSTDGAHTLLHIDLNFPSAGNTVGELSLASGPLGYSAVTVAAVAERTGVSRTERKPTLKTGSACLFSRFDVIPKLPENHPGRRESD